MDDRLVFLGLAHLKELPNLKQLIVTFCPGLTQAGVDDLKKALPNATIDF